MYEHIRLIDSQRIAIPIKTCGLCGGFIEGVEYAISEEICNSLDELLFKLLKQDKDGSMKVNFKSFTMECMTHHKQVPNSTFIEVTGEDLEKINNTPLSKIYLTLDEED